MRLSAHGSGSETSSGDLLGRLVRLGGLLGVFAVALTTVACAPEPARTQEEDLAFVDSVLAELGGTLTARLERGKRWRMVSSIGFGLPPTDFKAEDLPEPGSRGAGLLQVYCTQCHWLPTPQMHSALEWPLLVRRNLVRAQQLRDRLGGPLTAGLVGEMVMSGYETAELPSAADVDTLLAYLKKYALPTARPGELTEGPGRAVFMEKCSYCHELPSPGAHTASGWERLIGQMQRFMIVSDVKPLSPAEVDAIGAYLRERALRQQPGGD